MSTRTRLVWPDVAKGACILLVVLHHVIVKDFQFLLLPPLQIEGTFWHDVTYALKPVRMPLFFVVSGFFASRAVARPWPDAVRRIRGGYYLYVVWLAVMAVVYALEPDIPANRVTSPADFVGELLWAASSLWFLYALVAYYLVARLVRGLNPFAVVAAASLLSMSVFLLSIEENNRAAVLSHLVYYLVGALLPQAVRWVAERGLPLGPLTLGYVVTALLALHSPLPWTVTAFVASVAGIPLGITRGCGDRSVRRRSRSGMGGASHDAHLRAAPDRARGPRAGATRPRRWPFVVAVGGAGLSAGGVGRRGLRLLRSPRGTAAAGGRVLVRGAGVGYRAARHEGAHLGEIGHAGCVATHLSGVDGVLRTPSRRQEVTGAVRGCRWAARGDLG